MTQVGVNVAETEEPLDPHPHGALSLFNRVWPPALLAVGLGLTVAWITLLGYEFVGLVGTGL